MSLDPRKSEPQQRLFAPAGSGFPNNPRLPALIYSGVFPDHSDAIDDAFEAAFRRNGWTGCWRWSVYPYHHFHSNAHEALGVSRGQARIQLGGPGGEVFEATPGMLIVLPAGTAHNNLGSSTDFLVVGAYPKGQRRYDTLRGSGKEIEAILQRIAKTPLPHSDPVYGTNGPLARIWGP